MINESDDVLFQQFQQQMERRPSEESLVDPTELADLLRQLQNEEERAFLERNVRPRNAPAQWPDFVDRRPYLRFVLRNLLILDHILMALFLPFSIFTVLKTLINQVTFTKTDIFKEIIDYAHNRIVVDSTSSIVYLYRNDSSLLGCFHNSIVYHSAPYFKYLMNVFEGSNFLRQCYTIYIKLLTLVLYITYGVSVSSYISFVSFFFVVCSTLLLIKKFKGVDVILTNLLQTTSLIF